MSAAKRAVPETTFGNTEEGSSLHALLGELEAALVRIKKRGDDCACTFYGACGCGDACAEIASEALNSMRSRSPSAGDELRAGGNLDQHE